MNAAPWRQPISIQIAQLAAGEVAVESLVEGVRLDMVAAEPELNAWVRYADLAHVSTSPGPVVEASPLQGISVGVKDLIDVAGLPTRAGTVVTDAGPAARDAACVARLRKCGAIVQGKTVTTEFGYFAPGPTRNPHAYDHTPGGSSSGSAAAVGAGTIPIALGTQTAGSLTRPASFCGAAGMVFAHGSTSLSGVTGLSESLDSLGVLTRSIDDLEYVFATFFGRPHTKRLPASGLPDVHVWTGSDLDGLAPSMRTLTAMLPGLLRSLKVNNRPLRWDSRVRELADAHSAVMAYEAARTLTDTVSRHGDSLSEPLRALVEFGGTVSAQTRSKLIGLRDEWRAQLSRKLSGSSVVIGPAALGPAPAGLSATGSPVLSRPWQLLGLPVVVVPGVRTASGLPLGLQVIGESGSEHALFALARALEPRLAALPPIADR